MKRVYKYILTIPFEFCSMDELQDILKLMPIRFACGQTEIGESTSYKHYQVYIQLKSTYSITSLKKFLPTAHFEEQKGTNEQARDYCTKFETREGESFFIGEFAPTRGTDSQDFLSAAREGLSYNDLADSFPKEFLRYNSRIQFLRNLDSQDLYLQYSTRFRDNLISIFQYGDSGLGKSYEVYTKHKMKDIYVVTDYDHPFDLYQGQSVLVLEEFRGRFPIAFLLQLLDKYPCQLPCRFQNKYACFSTVYINTNVSLDELYPNCDKFTKRALRRRITEIRRYTAKGVYKIENRIELQELDEQASMELDGIF